MDARLAQNYTTADKRIQTLEKYIDGLQELNDSDASKRDAITEQYVNKRAEILEQYIDTRAEQLTTSVRGLLVLQDNESRFVSQQLSKLWRADAPAVCDFSNPILTTLKTSAGFHFYIMPVRIDPQVGGATIRFRVGNPYAAQFGETGIIVTYGIAKPKDKSLGIFGRGKPSSELLDTMKSDEEAESAWSRSLRTFSPTRREIIAAGAWTEVGVFIPDASPSQLQYVEVGLWSSAVALSQGK